MIIDSHICHIDQLFFISIYISKDKSCLHKFVNYLQFLYKNLHINQPFLCNVKYEKIKYKPYEQKKYFIKLPQSECLIKMNFAHLIIFP